MTEKNCSNLDSTYILYCLVKMCYIWMKTGLFLLCLQHMCVVVKKIIVLVALLHTTLLLKAAPNMHFN